LYIILCSHKSFDTGACNEVASFYCPDCEENEAYLCNHHNNEVHLFKSRKGHTSTPINAITIVEKKKKKRCETHNQPLEVWCTDCKRTLCLKCTLSEHRQHNSKLFEEAREVAERELENALKEAIGVSEGAKRAERMIDKAIDEMKQVSLCNSSF
jgi:B-box zinc finger